MFHIKKLLNLNYAAFKSFYGIAIIRAILSARLVVSAGYIITKMSYNS